MNIRSATVTHQTVSMMLTRYLQAIRMFGDSDNPEDKEKLANLMRPLLILGKPGIGKTVSIREFAKKKHKIGYKEIRLASVDSLDLGGLPLVEEGPDGTRFTSYAISKLLPNVERDGECGILVFDEITSCEPSARRATLKLFDSNRGINDYVLPPKWFCVALGNDVEDGGEGVEPLSGAFVNRFRCLRLEPDYHSWEIWADEHGINSSVMAFLKCYPELFYVDPVEGDVRIGASPRAWEGVATQLDFAEMLEGGRVDASNTEMFMACIASDVTPDIAARFAAFYAYNAEMIDPEEILAGKAKLNGKDAGARESIYLTIESCIALLIKRTKGVAANNMAADLQKQIGNFIRFTGMLQAAKGGEAAVSALEQLLRRVPVVAGLLSGATFKKEFPDEYRLLVATASKLTGIGNTYR